MYLILTPRLKIIPTLKEIMSFLSTLKKIGGGVVTVAKVAAPIVETFLPQSTVAFNIIDSLVTKTQTAIVTTEAVAPTAPGSTKLNNVIADFEAGLGITKDILSVTGHTISYDTVALTAAINAQVEAYNQFAKVKASFKISPATPVVPVPVV